MAVAAYTTDLTDIADLDTTGGTAVEPSSLYTAGRSPIEDDEDFPIQGTVHASLTFNTTGKGGILVPGTSWTYTSGDYIFGWLIWLAPSTIATYANGGLVMLLGSSASVFDVHYVGGSDFGKYPYGGWQNFAVDPERTPDENAGTPTAYHYVGTGANCISKVSKGNPLGFDVFRYGRGETRIAGGSSGDGYATFAGLAAINDASTAKWGLFQAIPGGYQWKGLMNFGYGSLTEFTDSNVNINIENSELVSSDFNRIEIRTSGTVINWTNINFTALGTVSKGELEMINDVEFNDNGGVFTDMSTFIYDSNYTGIGRTWRRCGQVTQGGGTFTFCDFDKSSSAVSLLVDDLSLVTGCTFNSDGSNHAVNLGTISATATISWDNTAVDYEAYNVAGSSTGNEVILVSVSSGQTLTVNVQSGATTPSFYNTGTGDVEIVAGAVDLVVSAIKSDGTAVDDVSIAVYAKDGTGDLPYEDSITVSNSGTTATITHTAHGMKTGDKILVRGGDQYYNRGVYTITVTTVNAYTYIMSGTPSGNPTGCTSTWCAMYVVTSGTNSSTVGRTFANDQPVAGFVRKSTTSPLYKSAPISGIIDKSLGLNLIGLMLLDE